MLSSLSFTVYFLCAVLFLVAQLCATLCDPMECSRSGSSVHGDSLGKNTGVGCHALLQGIFPTQGLSPSLPHCRQILCWLSHQGSPRILEWGSLSLLREIFPIQKLNQGLLHCTQILYQLSYQAPNIWVSWLYSSQKKYLEQRF